MNAYSLGMSTCPRETPGRTAYRRGSLVDTSVGLRTGNWPGWLLDQIHVLDADLVAMDMALLNAMSAEGCALMGQGIVYPATASTIGIEAGAWDMAAVNDSAARVKTQPLKCVVMATFYDSAWRTFLQSWADFTDDKRGHGLKGIYQRFWGWEVGDTINQFRDQLNKLRDVSGKIGFDLTALPTPSQPAAGAFDAAIEAAKRVARDAEEAGKGMAGLVKVLIYGLVGVGIMIALAFLFRGGTLGGGGGKLLMVKGT